METALLDKMTDEQIIKRVKAMFRVDAGGGSWGGSEYEYAGRLNQFVKFAQAIHEQSFKEGFMAGLENIDNVGQ